MIKNSTISLMAGSILLLSGCGGGGGGSTSSATARGTAFYVDAAVEGVTAVCGNTTTVTDANGAFIYEEGKKCQLKIGEIVLRTVENLYDGQVIIEDAIKTAQFLQTLDQDGNPDNGIKIIDQTAAVLSQIGVSEVPGSDAVLADIEGTMAGAGIGYNGTYTSEEEAQEHVNETYQQYNSGAEQPAQPNQPEQPSQPEQPAQPTQPQQPAQPSQPAQPQQPTQPAQPTQPNQPAQPAQPSQPQQPAQPSQPAQPTQPSQPQQPSYPHM
jgi:hypothetical protein